MGRKWGHRKTADEPVDDDRTVAEQLVHAFRAGWVPPAVEAPFPLRDGELLVVSTVAGLSQMRDGLWVWFGSGPLHVTSQRLAMSTAAGWVEWDREMIREVFTGMGGVMLSAVECPRTHFGVARPLTMLVLVRWAMFGEPAPVRRAAVRVMEPLNLWEKASLS